jgi:hypothetical protein
MIHLSRSQRVQLARFARIFGLTLLASGIVDRVLAGDAHRTAVVAAVVGAIEVAVRMVWPATPDRLPPA